MSDESDWQFQFMGAFNLVIEDHRLPLVMKASEYHAKSGHLVVVVPEGCVWVGPEETIEVFMNIDCVRRVTLLDGYNKWGDPVDDDDLGGEGWSAVADVANAPTPAGPER